MAPPGARQRGPPLSPSYFPAMALDETGANLRGHGDDQPEGRSSISDPVPNYSISGAGESESINQASSDRPCWRPTSRANYVSSPVRIRLH